MHYLYCGGHGVPPERIRAFLHNAGQGERGLPPAELRAEFQRQFGFDYPEMERRLEKYAGRQRFSYAHLPRCRALLVADWPHRRVPAAEMQARLAELPLRLRLDPAAQQQLETWVQQNPADARALEALGSAAWSQNKMDRAREYWARALAAGSENPVLRYRASERH